MRKSHRALYSLVSQLLRALSGVGLIAAIGTLPSAQDLADWYFLQGVLGWFLLLDVGLSSFISATIAKAAPTEQERHTAHGVLLMSVILVAAGIMAAVLFPVYIVGGGEARSLAGGVLFVGIISNLAALFLQAVLQGRGFVPETLAISCIAQAVVLVGIGVCLFIRPSLLSLAVVWASGNIVWVIATGMFFVRKCGSMWPLPAGLSLKRFLGGGRRPLLAYALGASSSIISTRLGLLVLATALPASTFATFAYASNAFVALISVLSFPMNGAVITAIRDATNRGADIWPALRSLALKSTFFIIFCLLSGLIIMWSIPALRNIALPKMPAGFGVQSLLALALVIEAFSAWFRTFSQADGDLKGVFLWLAFSIVSLGVAYFTRSIDVYISVKFVLALLLAAREFGAARRCIAKPLLSPSFANI